MGAELGTGTGAGAGTADVLVVVLYQPVSRVQYSNCLMAGQSGQSKVRDWKERERGVKLPAQLLFSFHTVVCPGAYPIVSSPISIAVLRLLLGKEREIEIKSRRREFLLLFPLLLSFHMRCVALRCVFHARLCSSTGSGKSNPYNLLSLVSARKDEEEEHGARS